MAQSQHVRELTDANFAKEIKNSQGLAVVDFWASWCQPCLALAPTIEAIAEHYKDKIKVGKLNVDDEQQTATSYGIRSLPTVLFFKDGEVVDNVVGLVPKDTILKKIEAHL